VTWLEREQQGRDAVNSFLAQACVFLLPGAGPPPAPDVASGTLISTPSGHLVVLTAKHIAAEAITSKYRLGYHRCPDVIPDFVAGVALHPDNVDVGLMLVKNSAVPTLRDLPVSYTSVPNDGSESSAGDALVINGFPAAASYYTETQAVQGFHLFTYWCHDGEPPVDARKRYRLAWRNLPGVESDVDFQAVPPGGMSGGPLWSFRNAPLGSVWSPVGTGRLIGIQSSWDRKDTLFVEPLAKWSAWFHKTVQHVDTYFHA